MAPEHETEMNAAFEDAAAQIAEEARKRGIVLRLLGALAFRYHLKSSEIGQNNRAISDLDFMGLSKQRKDVESLLNDLGYTPHERFNFVHGHQRLIFFHPKAGHRVDVFFDVFEMCHRFDFRDRLTVDDRTLSLADLVVTKLQIVERNEKDIRDLFYLLREHDVGVEDRNEVVNGRYIAQLCANEWGIWKTFTMNLEGSLKYLDEFLPNVHDHETVKARIQKLREMIDAEPKSTKWKMRARVGERRKWYNLPDSRMTF